MVSGQWSVISGQWSVISGQWSVVSDQWSVVSGQRLWRLIQGWHWLSSYELCKKHIQHSFDGEQKQEDRQIDGRDQEESAGQQLYGTEEEVEQQNYIAA